MKRLMKTLTMAGAMAAAAAAFSAVQAGEIVIGQMTDRTGVTANVGNPLGDGVQDYIKLVNSKGGVNGHTIRLIEIDNSLLAPGSSAAGGAAKRPTLKRKTNREGTEEGDSEEKPTLQKDRPTLKRDDA